MDDDTESGTGGEGADRKQQQQEEEEGDPVGTVVVGFSFMSKKMETMAEVGLSHAEVIHTVGRYCCCGGVSFLTTFVTLLSGHMGRSASRRTK